MQVPTLTTGRLVLREIAMGDWEPYAAMWSDPRVTAYIGGASRPRDIAWTKFCQSAGLWPLLGYGYWTVCDRTDDMFLGIAGFAQFERGYASLSGFPEAGWAFSAETWGRGIASETIGAIVAWADTHLAVAETRCMIDHDNIASARVAKVNGYVATGKCAGEIPVFRRPVPSA